MTASRSGDTVGRFYTCRHPISAASSNGLLYKHNKFENDVGMIFALFLAEQGHPAKGVGGCRNKAVAAAFGDMCSPSGRLGGSTTVRSMMNILNQWKALELMTREGETLVCIEGRVYGSNPRFPSSSHIRTSPVTGFSFEGNTMVVMTKRGSEYLLGKPDTSQPFAQQRLLRRLALLSQRAAPTSASFNELESQITGFDQLQKQETIHNV